MLFCPCCGSVLRVSGVGLWCGSMLWVCVLWILIFILTIRDFSHSLKDEIYVAAATCQEKSLMFSFLSIKKILQERWMYFSEPSEMERHTRLMRWLLNSQTSKLCPVFCQQARKLDLITKTKHLEKSLDPKVCYINVIYHHYRYDYH